MIMAGAEEARQDLELRRRYLAGELRDPTLESVLGSDIAGGMELGARQRGLNNRPAEPQDLVDSGLAQFLGRRLQEDQRESRLASLNNPEPMTNLGPGLGNATMRGDQVWVKAVEPSGAQEQRRVNDGAGRQENVEPPGGPSIRPGQRLERQENESARQQSQGGMSTSSQEQARQEQRLHAVLSAQHTLYATRYQRIVDLVVTIQR